MVSSENPSLDCSSFKGFIDSTCKSARILKTSLEVMIHQKMYSPEKVEFSWLHSSVHPKNSKFVSIYHNMKWYKVPFTIRRGPLQREITAIRDETGIDVTADILPFAGPAQDFFGMGITPRFFGMNKMTILSEGEEYVFSAETPIFFCSENLVTNLAEDEFVLPIDPPEIVLPVFSSLPPISQTMETSPPRVPEILVCQNTENISVTYTPQSPHSPVSPQSPTREGNLSRSITFSRLE